MIIVFAAGMTLVWWNGRSSNVANESEKSIDNTQQEVATHSTPKSHNQAEIKEKLLLLQMEKGNMIRERLEEQVTSDVTTRVNPSHLDSYLNDLEVQAIERGSVTFEDVRTGAELIRKYSSNQAPKIVQQQLNDFFLRMEILTHQLLNVSTEISASPSELLQQISATEEGITLPPEEFTKALEKLEELSQTENSNENASQIGELLREAENSQDEADRQRLIEESLRLIKEMDKRAD